VSGTVQGLVLETSTEGRTVIMQLVNGKKPRTDVQRNSVSLSENFLSHLSARRLVNSYQFIYIYIIRSNSNEESFESSYDGRAELKNEVLIMVNSIHLEKTEFVDQNAVAFNDRKYSSKNLLIRTKLKFLFCYIFERTLSYIWKSVRRKFDIWWCIYYYQDRNSGRSSYHTVAKDPFVFL
jgi:hypothetical protein